MSGRKYSVAAIAGWTGKEGRGRVAAASVDRVGGEERCLASHDPNGSDANPAPTSVPGSLGLEVSPYYLIVIIQEKIGASHRRNRPRESCSSRND